MTEVRKGKREWGRAGAALGLALILALPAMAQPEAYIAHADKLFDDKGQLTNDDTRKFLTNFMQSFAAWVAANTKG